VLRLSGLTVYRSRQSRFDRCIAASAASAARRRRAVLRRRFAVVVQNTPSGFRALWCLLLISDLDGLEEREDMLMAADCCSRQKMLIIGIESSSPSPSERISL